MAQTSFRLLQIQGLKCIQFGMLNVHFPGLLQIEKEDFFLR